MPLSCLSVDVAAAKRAMKVSTFFAGQEEYALTEEKRHFRPLFCSIFLRECGYPAFPISPVFHRSLLASDSVTTDRRKPWHRDQK